MSAAAESASGTDGARARGAGYFVNLPVDFLLIGGGSIVLFLLLARFTDGSRTGAGIQLAVVLTWLGNWPHFAATNYRLYGARAHLRQYPITAIAAPLLVAAGAAASFAAPEAIAPYFVKLFLLWSPFHYCGQSLGISLLYARRNRHTPETLERFFLSAFIYGTFFTRTLLAEVQAHNFSYHGVETPVFGVAPLAAQLASAWTYSCGAAFLLLLARTCLRERRWPPLLYMVPAATQYVWFYVAGPRPGAAEFVPFFHGLQYLLIAWAMQLKESADREGTTVGARFLAGRTLLWYAIIIGGGVVLFHLLPLAAARACGVGVPFATAVVLSAVQIHHFFVDGVIWKLKTASVVSPLLVNIPALVARTGVARPDAAAA